MMTINSFAESWWVYVVHATWQAVLVAVVALAVVTIFRRIPAPWRYALLLVALVKFAIPPSLTTSFGVFHWTAPVVAQAPLRAASVSERATNARTQAPGSMGKHSAADAPKPAAAQPALSRSRLVVAISNLSWKTWLMFLHAAGVGAGLGWILYGLGRLVMLTRRAQPISRGPLHERFSALSRQLQIKDDADLLVTDTPVPPVAFWLLRPKVMLPRPLLDTLSAEQLDTILAHEMLHHRRNDWAANLLQLVILAAWWFNPLAWLIHRALSRTREECCDDALLALSLTTPDRYTQTLLSAARQFAHRQPLAATLGFAERLHPMGDRVKRILDPALKRVPRLSPEAFVVVAVVSIATLPGLRSGRAEPVAEPPPPDVARGPIDPYVPGHERAKFLQAAGVDSLMNEAEFNTSAKAPNGFARVFDRWENLLLFDKNGDGLIDWFEADEYRQAMRVAVLARYDRTRIGYLKGSERIAANRDLAAGRAPAIDGSIATALHAGVVGASSWNNLFAFETDASIDRFDGDGNGVLDEHELAAISDDSRAGLRLVQLVERQFDENGDGKLSGDEVKAFELFRQQMREISQEWDAKMRGPGQGYGDLKIEPGTASITIGISSIWLFARLVALADQDGDGVVTPDEAQAFRMGIIGAFESRIQGWIDRFDADGSARLSAEERTEFLGWLRHESRTLIDRYDADGDGRLSPIEAGHAAIKLVEMVLDTFPK